MYFLKLKISKMKTKKLFGRRDAKQTTTAVATAPAVETGTDYADLFFRGVAIPARSGKSVYICRQHHQRITDILHVIAKKEVTLFDYIHNVLEHHFNTFQGDITELYDRNLRKPF